MSNIAAFNAAIDRFSRSLTTEQLVVFHKKIVFQVLAGVVKKTPVDTGYARGSWHTTINEQSDLVFTEIRGADIPTSEGLAILQSLKPFSVVYVTNNASYIVALENGHSKQAGPNVMLAGTLEQVKAQFE